MAKILLELDSWSIEEAGYKLAQMLIAENPNLTKEQVANTLGVSERSLYRWVQMGMVTFPKVKRESAQVIRAIQRLTKEGYIVYKSQA
jgi:predicted DNA-binding transcriptional regulator AlpA